MGGKPEKTIGPPGSCAEVTCFLTKHLFEQDLRSQPLARVCDAWLAGLAFPNAAVRPVWSRWPCASET